jgi:uncharacterized damage-inducible protein DinB
MTRPILADAFDHHTWATLRLIDACRVLSPEQLESPVPGTFGSIIDTLRHTVGAEAGYLFSLTYGSVAGIDEDGMGPDALAEAMASLGTAWPSVLEAAADPDQEVARLRDDGTRSIAPLGIRLAQVLHHGSDHRSQVCTALTLLGITPPEIDCWDFADTQGRLSMEHAGN